MVTALRVWLLQYLDHKGRTYPGDSDEMIWDLRDMLFPEFKPGDAFFQKREFDCDAWEWDFLCAQCAGFTRVRDIGGKDAEGYALCRACAATLGPNPSTSKDVSHG